MENKNLILEIKFVSGCTICLNVTDLALEGIKDGKLDDLDHAGNMFVKFIVDDKNLYKDNFCWLRTYSLINKNHVMAISYRIEEDHEDCTEKCMDEN